LSAAELLLDGLREHPDVIRCSAAGSLRRFKEVIGDIDLLASSKKPAEVIGFFVAQPGIIKVTAKGETKASVILDGGIQCDLRVVSDREFPFALAYFTGSKEHNIVMRQRAIQRGLRLNEYGLFKSNEETRDPKRLVPCRDETEIFTKLDLPFVPPELREDHGEFAAGEKNDLPRAHRMDGFERRAAQSLDVSDGRNRLEEIAEYMEELGLAYWAITDIRSRHFRRMVSTENAFASKSRKSKRLTGSLPNAAAIFVCSPELKWTFCATGWISTTNCSQNWTWWWQACMFQPAAKRRTQNV